MDESVFDTEVKGDIYSPQKIDVIGTTEIYARVIAGPTPHFGRKGKVLALHLEIVSGTGAYFTLVDLKKMSLQRNELHQLGDFCRRRQQLLGSLYFPRTSAEDIDLRSGVTFVDIEKSEVRVTFFLTKLLPHD